MLGLCLIAALGVAAITAAGASALPEFGKCEVSPTHEGKYTDKACVKKAKAVGGKFTGEFEWHTSITFKENVRDFSNGTGEATPSTLTSIFNECRPSEEKLAKCREGETEERFGPIKVECEGIFDQGEFSTKSAKEVRNIHTTFTGCKALGVPCTNTGVAGTVETNLLKGTVGYIKKAAPKEVGVSIMPQSGKEFAKFTCGAEIQIQVGEAVEKEGPAYPTKGGGDSVIGVVTPLNEMVSSFKQAFTANEETSENIPSKLEGKPLDVLENFFTNLGAIGHGSKWSPAGETVTVNNSCKGCKGEEGVGELKA
jgi:hypothetical protein